jgi:hypothetical protein
MIKPFLLDYYSSGSMSATSSSPTEIPIKDLSLPGADTATRQTFLVVWQPMATNLPEFEPTTPQNWNEQVATIASSGVPRMGWYQLILTHLILTSGLRSTALLKLV